jgi:hypothetical protein
MTHDVSSITQTVCITGIPLSRSGSSKAEVGIKIAVFKQRCFPVHILWPWTFWFYHQMVSYVYSFPQHQFGIWLNFAKFDKNNKPSDVTACFVLLVYYHQHNHMDWWTGNPLDLYSGGLRFEYLRWHRSPLIEALERHLWHSKFLKNAWIRPGPRSPIFQNSSLTKYPTSDVIHSDTPNT